MKHSIKDKQKQVVWCMHSRRRERVT